MLLVFDNNVRDINMKYGRARLNCANSHVTNESDINVNQGHVGSLDAAWVVDILAKYEKLRL